MTGPIGTDELCKRLLQASLEVQEAIERKKAIEEELMLRVKPGDQVRTDLGGFRVMPPPTRFDPAMALAQIPVQDLSKVIKAEISGPLVKRLMPDIYESSRKIVGAPFLRQL